VRNTQNPNRLGQRTQDDKLDSQSNLNVLSHSSKGLPIPERPYRRREGRADTNEHMTARLLGTVAQRFEVLLPAVEQSASADTLTTAVMLTLWPLCADRNLRKQRSVGL